MEILKREYTVEVNKIKGYEKLEQDQVSEIKDGNLFRFIVVLDDTRYTINAEGDPEMTKVAQEEYDDFISKIRQKIMDDGISILDEGYGVDEDELDWHITGYVMNPKTEGKIAGLIEFDTCVRTKENDGNDS